MRLAQLFSTFACVAFLLTALPLQAEDSALDISGLIKQLDSSKFGEREVASRKLAEAGPSALEEVAKAASSGSREVSTRAFQLLKDWKDRGGADVKAGAKAALEKLAKSEDKRIARRANMALNPPADNQAQAVPNIQRRVQVFPVPARGLQGNIKIQVRGIQINGGANGVRKIQIQNNNGTRKIEVTEGEKKIRIDDDPKGGIQIQVTEKVKGKETTKKYEAKNKEELKKKHPEIRKLYDKYAGNQAGGIQIGAQAIPVLPNQIQKAIPLQKLIPRIQAQPQKARAAVPQLARPVRPAAAKPVPAKAARPEAVEAVALAQKELQAALEQLKKATEEKPADVPELRKHIEAAAKRLAEAQQQLAE